MNIHFFGGIHGVGKTFLCKRLSSQLSIKHFSAGELINQGIQKNKEVKSINCLIKIYRFSSLFLFTPYSV